MKIELSEDDIKAVAAQVHELIRKDLVRSTMAEAGFRVMMDEAKTLATQYMRERNLQCDVMDCLREVIAPAGKDALKDEIRRMVRELADSNGELEKAVRENFAQMLIDHAQSVAADLRSY